MKEKNLWLKKEGILAWCWRELNLEKHSANGKAERIGKSLCIKAWLRVSFDLQIFENTAQKHPCKDVSKQRGHGRALWSTSPVQLSKLLPLGVRREEGGPWRHFRWPSLPQSYPLIREHSRVPPPVSPDFFLPLLVKIGFWKEEISLNIQPSSQNHPVCLDIRRMPSQQDWETPFQNWW